ncbi:hypothetical protein [Escherichia coli]|uniref:hypothetical protein n=1 Tax=Escherichia coli TaxID=562 RepID=UPI002091BADF|nr:hypothetical protein [Escherichia coli]MCO4902607.1 hypothetical protein [Escherichia coli]
MLKKHPFCDAFLIFFGVLIPIDEPRDTSSADGAGFSEKGGENYKKFSDDEQYCPTYRQVLNYFTYLDEGLI